MSAEKQSWESEIKVFQGRNSPGLEGYLRWKLSTSSLAYTSSISGNYSESLLVSLYPSHIIL